MSQYGPRKGKFPPITDGGDALTEWGSYAKRGEDAVIKGQLDEAR